MKKPWITFGKRSVSEDGMTEYITVHDGVFRLLRRPFPKLWERLIRRALRKRTARKFWETSERRVKRLREERQWHNS